VNVAFPIQTTRRTDMAIFAAVAAGIAIMGVVALQQSAGAAVVVTAVTIDLVVVIPLLHYVFIVRRRGMPLITLLPVFRLSLAAAAFVLPAGDRPLYEALAHLARPAEVAIAGYILYRIYLGWRALNAAGTDDVLERYRIGVRAMLPETVLAPERTAAAIAFEAAVVWFATRAWRARPEAPAGSATFTGHRKAGYGGMVAGLLLVVIIDLLLIHILVSLWSSAVAWVLTGLGLYTLVWIVGDLQAIRLRPSWMDGDRLCMRLGLRWSVAVPRTAVRGVRKLGRGEAVTGALKLALPNAPRVLVELDAPATAEGVYGMMRTVNAVELGVDDPDAFVQQFGPEVDGGV
jgi:hypothetical protein